MRMPTAFVRMLAFRRDFDPAADALLAFLNGREIQCGIRLQAAGQEGVDDKSLASFTIVLIALIAGAVKILDFPPLWGGLLLIVGLVAILLESVLRATRTGKKR